MDWFNVISTSVAMSVDAMCVGASDGVSEEKMPLIKKILIAFSFGLFQFVMPVIGYFIGQTFVEFAKAAVPWIGFGLLTLLAIKCFVEWLINFKKPDDQINKKKFKFLEILVQDVATSIDALCIGFVYMAQPIANAMLIFGIIGITTFILSFITIFLANLLAGKLAKWGNLISSIVFLAVAIKILIEGLL